MKVRKVQLVKYQNTYISNQTMLVAYVLGIYTQNIIVHF